MVINLSMPTNSFICWQFELANTPMMHVARSNIIHIVENATNISSICYLAIYNYIYNVHTMQGQIKEL